LFIFGDSSADVGSDGNRYTNRGAMWAETLAGRLGLSSTPARGITLDDRGGFDRRVPVRRLTGTNYAVGGATAAPWPGTAVIPGAVDFADQVRFFREDHRAGFAADDLVIVWMGGNDSANALLSGQAHDTRRYADAYMAQIAALRQAGARNLVAVNEPATLLPVRYYQDLLELEPADAAALVGLTSADRAADNAALRPRLVREGVYILDMDRLARDVLARPRHYGFTATTDGYMTLGDPRNLPDDGNVFADNHFSAAMQAVVADFALAQMAARDRFATLAAEPLESLRATETDLAQHLTGAQAWLVPVGGLSVTASADLSRREIRDRGTDPGHRTDAAAARLGVEWRMTDGLALGLQAAWREIDADIPLAGFERDGAAGGGGHEGRDVSATLYGLLRPIDGLTFSLAVTGGQVEHETIERRTRLGAQAVETARGETEARYAAIRLGAAYELDLGAGWNLTPAVAGTWSRVETDGYTEAAGPLSLSYGDAVVEEGRVGGSLTLARSDADSVFRPYLTVGVDHVVDGRSVTVRVGPAADARVDYRTDRPNRTRARAVAGLDLALSPALRLGVSAGAERGIGDKAETKVQPWARAALTIGF
jgi:phospholipase/lecithinase/hemolysin/uncharacterized protein YhjY with autotransporter beta-barrel domain